MSSSTQTIDGDELYRSNTERDDKDPDSSLYTEWLMGALEQGVVPDRFRVRTPHARIRDHKIVTRNSTIPANHGDKSEKYVIPSHVDVDADFSGHDDFYFMDDFEPGPNTTVEVFPEEIAEVAKKYPEAIEESDRAAFMLQATCSSECAWDSGLTENPDHLLHRISQHSTQDEHSVVVTEVVVQVRWKTEEDEDGNPEEVREVGDILHERPYNASGP